MLEAVAVDSKDATFQHVIQPVASSSKKIAVGPFLSSSRPAGCRFLLTKFRQWSVGHFSLSSVLVRIAAYDELTESLGVSHRPIE